MPILIQFASDRIEWPNYPWKKTRFPSNLTYFDIKIYPFLLKLNQFFLCFSLWITCCANQTDNHANLLFLSTQCVNVECLIRLQASFFVLVFGVVVKTVQFDLKRLKFKNHSLNNWISCAENKAIWCRMETTVNHSQNNAWIFISTIIRHLLYTISPILFSVTREFCTMPSLYTN